MSVSACDKTSVIMNGKSNVSRNSLAVAPAAPPMEGGEVWQRCQGHQYAARELYCYIRKCEKVVQERRKYEVVLVISDSLGLRVLFLMNLEFISSPWWRWTAPCPPHGQHKCRRSRLILLQGSDKLMGTDPIYAWKCKSLALAPWCADKELLHWDKCQDNTWALVQV